MIKANTGYFDEKSNEFVITNMKTRRELKNFLFNEKMIASLNQFGFGVSQGQTECGFRNLLTEQRLVYINQGEQYYAANRNYEDLPFDIFECHVGIAYQKIISQYLGIKTELNIVIPHDDYCEINHIQITNTTDESKKIKLVYMNRPFVNLTWHTAYTIGDYYSEYNAIIFSHDGFDIKEKNRFIMCKSSEPIDSFETSLVNFKGIYNSFAHPLGLVKDHLSNQAMTFDDENACCMSYEIIVPPHQSKNINFVICFASSIEKANLVAEKYISEESYQRELNQYLEENRKLQKKFFLDSPDQYLNILMNIWLKRQIDLGKTWGRVYGKGFRDVMQDNASIVSLDSVSSREKIINTLKYQFENGNTIRQFDPILDYPYQDGASWICSTLLSYLKETNDFSILEEKVPYYQSKQIETVFRHAQRGIDYLLHHRGSHLLVLWGGGDWNDSLNSCGLKGRGESVWLSMATVKAGYEFIEIAKKAQKSIDIERYEKELSELKEMIIKYGFEGNQFIYGYNDEGDKIGSKQNDQGACFLNVQTWSVLASIGSKDIQEKVMEQVEKKLKCSFGYVQLSPSFNKGSDQIGRASYFYPGTYENGSVYNHGVAFKIAADYHLNHNDLAYQTLQMILPINNPDSGMEPYAIGNMYLGPECKIRSGYAPMPWITGTAGWIYKNTMELMLGIIPDYDGLIIAPHLPSTWREVKITRVYQQVTFNITIKKTGLSKLYVNNKNVPGNKVYISPEPEMNVIYEY